MANLNVPVKIPTRECTVDGRRGYFHSWAQYSQIVPPSLLVGGHSGGVVAEVLGIVEFADCVELVYPRDIKFVDELHTELVACDILMKGHDYYD